MKLYFKSVAMTLKGQMQYKTSFFLTILGQFGLGFTAIIAVYFIFLRFDTVGGFTLNETLICFGVMMFAMHFAEFFFRGFDLFPRLIKSGDFDRVMLRPRGLVYQVILSLTDFTRLGRAAQGVFVLGFAIYTSGVIWTWDKVLTMIFMIVGASVVFCGLFMVYGALSFFSTEGLEFMNIFTNGGETFGQYPVAIYGKGVLRFLTFVIPFALVQYYPFTYLVGRSDDWRLMLLPLIATLFIIPCYILWRIGVRHYKSVGS